VVLDDLVHGSDGGKGGLSVPLCGGSESCLGMVFDGISVEYHIVQAWRPALYCSPDHGDVASQIALGAIGR